MPNFIKSLFFRFFQKIIHNYGHGGNGIALSRGTVLHAIDLLLNEESKVKSKL